MKEKMDRRIKAITAAAACAAGATSAHAAVIGASSPPAPVTVSGVATYDVDIDASNGSEFTLGNQSAFNGKNRYYGDIGSNSTTKLAYSAFTDSAHQINGSGFRTTALNFGDLIDGSLNYTAPNNNGNSDTLVGDGSANSPGNDQNVGLFPADGTTHYVGVEFSNPAISAGPLFGWVGLSFTNNGSQATPATITGWGYETSGAGITAGAVPEPTGLGLLVLGAAGVLRRKRTI